MQGTKELQQLDFVHRKFPHKHPLVGTSGKVENGAHKARRSMFRISY